jgi:hypothetical protein
VRKVGDETGYLFRTGLYLIISEARKRKGQWVHEFKYGVSTNNDVKLVDAPDELEFIKALKEGDTLCLPSDLNIPLDHWGNLKYLGYGIKALEKVLSYLNLPGSNLKLKDVGQSYILMTAELINAFIEGIGVEKIVSGFVFELAGKNLKEENWKECRFKVPIVMNLQSHGVVIWLTGKGSMYFTDDCICGFRPEQLEHWTYEVRDELFPEVIFPELWFYKNWPPIPLGITKSMNLKFKKELPFGGELI